MNEWRPYPTFPLFYLKKGLPKVLFEILPKFTARLTVLALCVQAAVNIIWFGP